MINYTYQVVRVDRAHGIMDVKYSSEEYGSQTIGMPLPAEGQSVEARVAEYSPVASWLQQDVVSAQVSVGTSGALTFTPTVSATGAVEKTRIAAELRQFPHGDSNLWVAFKEQIALADEETRDDWGLATAIASSNVVLRAVLTTLVGDQAQAIIDAIYDA